MYTPSPVEPVVRSPARKLVLAVAVVWFLLALLGLWALTQYAHTPGADPTSPADWPADSKIVREPHGNTLVMFAHPKCPCTRASLSELERIVAQSNGTIKPRVVFFKPGAAEQDWEHTNLWNKASAIPGAVVSSDLDGEEARRFHAFTSGQTLMYDAAGKRLFSGGITAARGHEGDSAGHDALVSLLTEGSAECQTTPVFGCPIVTDSISQGKRP